MLKDTHKKYLKGLCHHLKPVVMLGNKGLTEAVQSEIEVALSAHELIKIKLSTDDRDQKAQWIERIAATHSAELVQKIGHVACFYRHNKDQQKIVLPG